MPTACQLSSKVAYEYECPRYNNGIPDWDNRLVDKLINYDDSWQVWNYSAWRAHQLLQK